MNSPFIIFSLPRSRSAWLARFLSYKNYRCGHDIAPQCTTVKEFVDLLCSGYCGTAETGAIVGWRAILRLLPDVRIVVICRRVQEVFDSLARFGVGSPALMNELIARSAMLDRLSAQPNVRTFSFSELNEIRVCQRLFEFCLGEPFDWEWWESLANVNVQVEVAERVKYLADNHVRIEALKADARRVGGDGDIVIASETWESVWPAIDCLFAEHFAEVEGDLANNRPYRLDEPEMCALHAKGHLRIWTARVDGALVGYCMWTVTKDVESAGILIALHGPWFVRKQFAHLHLGRKLFDASIDGLRKSGVRCAFPHHRLAGRGAKLGAFFRRRGAVETQHTYSLWLGETAHA
jgi:hypothetical protein